ncbi:BnaA08g00180D [Brassica napus]|uniref:F-box/LRR-repeat protein 15/At3g58940/PEG3-like LRR domain-containing protein n=2 Tax=Brassica TaxID=3705 RepID=M4EPV4_BRACM|nr:unnamed protein product [Brassica napus]CDY42396.1 BnaA08g00180D [Brassica napus]
MVFDPSLPKAGLRFIDFVRRTLVLLGDSPIHKFSLEWKSEKAQHLIYPLIYNALQREVLELHLISPKRQFVPSELFFSKTLVKLTLALGCFARETTTFSVLFPALKSLSLFSVMFAASSEMYGVLLASPLLEEIHIFYDGPYSSFWIKQVWGSSIKRITIFYRSCDLDDSCFIFKTPSLVFLDYSSYVAQDYLVQFDDSLVEARLDIRLWKYYDHVLPLPISLHRTRLSCSV